MEASSPTERREIFSRSHGLRGREDVLLRHLAEGADTRTLANLMSISEHTVQDHLKSVFLKTSTSSRRELLAKSAGNEVRIAPNIVNDHPTNWATLSAEEAFRAKGRVFGVSTIWAKRRMIIDPKINEQNRPYRAAAA